MNKLVEFRRLRWSAAIQENLQQLRKNLLATKLMQLNSDETALEFANQELLRLARLEAQLLELSFTYDFEEDFTREDIVHYINSFVGLQDLS